MSTTTLDQALGGVIPPLVTPLHEDRTLDEERLPRLVRRCLDAGCSGIFVNGSTGEGPWLTAAQRRRAVQLAASTGTVVLAGVMLPGTSMTLEAAADAEAAGADAVVVAAPYYFAAGDDAIRRHVEAVAAAVRIPVILYNIPQTTHNPMSAAVVERLAADPRVIGIKDSSGDMDLFRSRLLLRDRRPFRVLQGAERVMGESLRLGADGLVPGSANVSPDLFVGLRRAVREGDDAAARAAEQRIGELVRIYSIAPGFAAMKAACSVLGVCSRMTAAPLAPATDEQTEQIAGILRAAGLEEPATRF